MGVAVFAAYTALVMLASLNRETGLLLVGFYWAFFGFSRRLLLLSVLWAAITVGLHLVYGPAPAQFGGLVGTFALNQETLPSALFANVLLLPLWIGAGYYWRGSSLLFKRLLVCVALYVGAFLVGAIWQEVRLLLPVLVVALPVVLRGEHEAPAR